MPRRKPISGKQKKEQQQIKRAIKRGDLLPPEPTKKPSRKRRPVRTGPTGKVVGQGSSDAAIASAKKLQSAFVELPPRFLEETKAIASTIPLTRPISYDVTLFHDFATDGQTESQDVLTCPKRPKWRFDMSKKEVEHNEEGLFKKWLANMDGLVEQWQKSREPAPLKSEDLKEQFERPLLAPPSPTYFERNLEVWRQLWRVTELSQIILVLLDSRCPLLHFPPSLADYLANQKVILVLTKVDITGPICVGEWMRYIKVKYPKLRVVQVESYIEKETTTVHQGKKQYEPRLPDTFRHRLMEAIKEVHAEMLDPPEKVAKNPEWLQNWIPPVKREIDWDGVLNAGGGRVGAVVGGAAVPRPTTEDEDEDEDQDSNQNKESEQLTVGLIGQPNVGKSSLLNALFGARRVRASKTPGKTKHFQTLYWTKDVRFVDCPGLVMPNYVPMEMQAIQLRVLPISKVSAVSACINYVANLLPLERVYKLDHPAAAEPPLEDKRTWREGMRPPKPKLIQWTAMDVLAANATTKGWVTAKVGRPDIHRAGNAILRALAEGRVSWAFWPSDIALELVAKESSEPGAGIWIPGKDREDEESGEDSGEEGGEESGEDVNSEVPSDIEDNDGNFPTTGAGRFGALQINDSESEEG
ncbi:Guanine nucleotide-binding protein-like 1 [Leucoagaricus sp. SymC.cos]|nr:Guanine nucleotide-binding protein-like 1 [Leucoagaricus sp. SymC.cos]